MQPKPKVVGESLKSLSHAVRKHLQRLTDALEESDLGKREKAIGRLMKMLELANDNAMLQGLGLSFAKITQLKSANLKVKPKSEHTKESSPHHDLIRFAEQKSCGTLPNYPAVAACVKWILDAGFDALEVKDCWNDLEREEWRGAITIFVVKNNIGAWKMRKVNRPLIAETKVDRTLRAVENVKARNAN
jgi:hypothetical protein